MEAALKFAKALIFKCGKAQAVEGGARVMVVRGNEAFNMMCNSSFIMNVENAEAAVEADRVRELAKIGMENFAQVNRTVAAALASGANAVCAKPNSP